MIKKISDSISERLDKMVKTATGFEQIWKREVKKVYLKYQEQRFLTKNWGKWSPLDPKYEKWKMGTTRAQKRSILNKSGKRSDKKKSIVDGGKSMMVLTGQLRGSLLDKNNEYKEVITNNEALVYTTVPYAYTGSDAKRRIEDFKPEFKKNIRKVFRDNMVRR